MLMRPKQPFTEIETIRQQLDKAFDGLAAARDNSEAAWMPALELADAGDNFVLKAQLPGIDPKDIDVQVTREAISISGERRYENTDEKSGYVRSEFRYGKFHRVLSLLLPIPVFDLVGVKSRVRSVLDTATTIISGICSLSPIYRIIPLAE